jgi:hypothetical protein
MKLCKDCKYYKIDRLDMEEYCQHPNHGISLVTGKADKKSVVWRTIPYYNKLCGKEGSWFEQRKPFWKFWS